MIPLTFNNLDNWRHNSQLWNKFDNLNQEQEHRHVHWNESTDRYKYNSSTSYRNIMFSHIMKEYRSMFGVEYNQDVKHYGHYDLFTQKKLNEEERFQQRAQVYIHTSISSILDNWSIEFTVKANGFEQGSKRFNFTPRSNAPLTEEYIVQATFEYINKHLIFPEGLFRNFQEAFNGTKEYALKQYRLATEQRAQDIKRQDREDRVNEYIFKRFNIDIDYDLNATEKQIIDRCKEFTRINGKPQDTLTLCQFRPLYILDGFDGDIDEVESLLDEHLTENPTVIYL